MIKSMNVSMKPYSDQEVLDFINMFGEDREALKGEMSYWFARILSERFGAPILYLAQDNLFCVAIGGRYYDARGNITSGINPNYAVCWRDYQHKDPAHAARIVREAIWKIPSEVVPDAE